MHRLVIALTTLLGLTAAVYLAGHLLLFNGAADAAGELAPADTALYLIVSLQPSSAQDTAIAQLASRIPGFADASTLDDKVDALAQNLAAQAGLDYRADLKPWLGDQIAAALPAGPEASPMLFVAVGDRAAADEAMGRLEGRHDEPFVSSTHDGVEIRSAETLAYAFVAETLVVAADAAAVQSVIDVHGGAESLADRSDFAEAMATLPTDRLAAGYIDLKAFLGEGSRYPFAVGALVADSEGLVVRGRSGTATAEAAGSASGAAESPEAATLAGWMPADTQLAISAFDGAELLFSAESILADAPAAEGLTGTLQSVRGLLAFGLGIDLDDLLMELMRGEAGLALRGLDSDAPSGLLLLRPDDMDVATSRLEELTDLLAGSGASVDRTERGDGELVSVGLAGIASLAYAISGEVIVLGLETEAVEAVLDAAESGDTLASLDAYRAAFELAGERNGNEIYMDPAVLPELLGIADGLPADARDILAQLGAFAVTLPDGGDHLEIHAALTVD